MKVGHISNHVELPSILLCRNRFWLLRWLRPFRHGASRLPLSQSLIVLVKPLAEVFLLGLEGSLRGIAIQVLAALAFYIGDNFFYFHQCYLAEVRKRSFFGIPKNTISCVFRKLKIYYLIILFERG